MKNMKYRTALCALAMWIALGLMTKSVFAQAPWVETAPTSQAVAQGGTASFTMTMSGSLPITYSWMWFKNNAAPIMYYHETLYSTNCTIVLTNVQLSDAGFFNIDTQNAEGYGPGKQVALGVIASGMETNGFALTVYGLTNSSWAVNFKTNLAQPDWIALTNFSIPKNPRLFKFVDLEATNLNRFYQVIPSVQ